MCGGFTLKCDYSLQFNQYICTSSGQCQSVCSNCRIGPRPAFSIQFQVFYYHEYLHPQLQTHTHAAEYSPPFIPGKQQLNSIVPSMHSERAAFSFCGNTIEANEQKKKKEKTIEKSLSVCR